MIYYFPTLNVYVNTIEELKEFLCDFLKSKIRATMADKTIKFITLNGSNDSNEIGNYLTIKSQDANKITLELFECSMKQFGWVFNNIQKRMKSLFVIDAYIIRHAYIIQMKNEKSENDKSENDKMIVMTDNLTYKKWTLNGLLHRPEKDGPAIERASGTKEWWFNDQRHRKDGPAIEYADGDKEWYVKNQRHREDGPAVENANGNKEWYYNGQRHREDGPAIEYVNGDKVWYYMGQLHREDGPVIEYANGDKSWYYKNQLHREDGPAIEGANGTKWWYVKGKLHRKNGPAIERASGDKEWWFEGKHMTEQEFNEILREKKNENCSNESSSNEEVSNEQSTNESTMTIEQDGTKTWRNLQGQYHRKDGPAIERANGTKVWYFNGQIHRDDGPAIERTFGAKEWWFNDQRHRKDGPAIEYADGAK
jgi:hypothetical protein